MLIKRIMAKWKLDSGIYWEPGQGLDEITPHGIIKHNQREDKDEFH